MVPLVLLLAAGGPDHPGPGVHLSLGARPGDFVASWSTPLTTSATLHWGPRPGALVLSAVAVTTTLANNEPMSGPGKAGPWRNTSCHHATVTDVQPGATVFYSVGDDRVLNFTNTVPHGRAGPVTFAVFGDLGIKEQEGANWTLARLKEHRSTAGFDAVLHVGDIAYDLRQDGGRTGDEFLADMEPVAAAVPYLTCVGNHERDCVSNTATPEGSCVDPPYTNYRTRFAMPTADPADMFWSADIGAAHIIALNTDTYLLGPGMAPTQLAALNRQLAWLEADLQAAAANRKAVPWIIAIGHEMLYSTHDASHQSQARILRDGGDTTAGGDFQGLESLFHDYSVDLYFAGHEHVYEHFARIYKGQRCTAATAGTKCGLSPRPDGCPCTAHIVVGNAGNREFPYHDKNGSVEAFNFPQPDFESFRSTSPAGFGLLAVNETTMVWEQFNAKTGAALDSHVYHR